MCRLAWPRHTTSTAFVMQSIIGKIKESHFLVVLLMEVSKLLLLCSSSHKYVFMGIYSSLVRARLLVVSEMGRRSLMDEKWKRLMQPYAAVGFT